MKIEKIALIAVSLVVLLVGCYAAFLIIISWPVDTLSISNAALYGDSFGILNSLFSGLAFAGIIITILLQRDELRLQREELSRASKAQETSARMAALTLLIEDYKSRIAVNADTTNKMDGYQMPDQKRELIEETKELCKKRDLVLSELESITLK